MVSWSKIRLYARSFNGTVPARPSKNLNSVTRALSDGMVPLKSVTGPVIAEGALVGEGTGGGVGVGAGAGVASTLSKARPINTVRHELDSGMQLSPDNRDHLVYLPAVKISGLDIDHIGTKLQGYFGGEYP